MSFSDLQYVKGGRQKDFLPDRFYNFKYFWGRHSTTKRNREDKIEFSKKWDQW